VRGAGTTERTLRRRGLRLEYLTLGWNVVGTVVVTLAALAARSIALAGFEVRREEQDGSPVLRLKVEATASLGSSHGLMGSHQLVDISESRREPVMSLRGHEQTLDAQPVQRYGA